MEASKISIDPAHLAVMKPKDARALREQRVIDLIKNTPSGVPLGSSDFAKVTMKTPNNAYNMIQQMLKRKQIFRVEVGIVKGKPRYAYSLGSGKVFAPKKAKRGRPSKQAGQPPTTTRPTGKFDFTEAITNLKELGLAFTITITNEGGKHGK